MKRPWGSIHDEMKGRLSQATFAEIVEKFGGRFVRIPRRIRETRKERNDRIVKMLESNTWRETAEEVGCSLDTVARASGRPSE